MNNSDKLIMLKICDKKKPINNSNFNDAIFTFYSKNINAIINYINIFKDRIPDIDKHDKRYYLLLYKDDRIVYDEIYMNKI